jgi:hypothetical protein
MRFPFMATETGLTESHPKQSGLAYLAPREAGGLFPVRTSNRAVLPVPCRDPVTGIANAGQAAGVKAQAAADFSQQADAPGGSFEPC